MSLDYLYGLERFGIKLGLDVVTKLLERLGDPHKDFKSIHITGTNGKGSTTAYLASILQQAGYKVGMYTSPHLVRFNERVKVGGKDISDADLVRLIEKVKEKAEGLEPTFFEFTTALAFAYFSEQKIDFAVVEVGMGARLDATNVLMPEIAVITNISFDHQKYLGDTLEKIALEKAAIIKKNSIVVTAETKPEILSIFKQEAKTKDSLFFALENYTPVESDLEYQRFIFRGEDYLIRLLGEHQVKNACLAIQAILLLAEQRKVDVSIEQIKKGLFNTRWPGRMQFLRKNLLIDCAHNMAGMEYLRKFVIKIPDRTVLVLGIAEDKEISKMVSLLVPLFKKVILTQGNYKPASLDILEQEVKKYCPDVIKIKNPREAVKEALTEKGLVLVTGSIYMVGDVVAAVIFGST